MPVWRVLPHVVMCYNRHGETWWASPNRCLTPSPSSILFFMIRFETVHPLLIKITCDISFHNLIWHLRYFYNALPAKKMFFALCII